MHFGTGLSIFVHHFLLRFWPPALPFVFFCRDGVSNLILYFCSTALLCLFCLDSGLPLDHVFSICRLSLDAFPCPLADLAYCLIRSCPSKSSRVFSNCDAEYSVGFQIVVPRFTSSPTVYVSRNRLTASASSPFTPVEFARLGFLELERRSISMRRLRWSSLPPHFDMIDGQASGPK
jgi:hypothetical protein